MSFFLSFLIFISLLYPVKSMADTSSLAIHLGSFSMDSHTHTQAEIDALVGTIAANIPNAQYIAIGTYLDYPDQIRMYADAIHANGKHVWFRSAGFNDWQGTFGSAATGTPTTERARMVQFIQNNYWSFAPGDIFEAVPDEPENGTYWYNTYGSSGVGTNAISKAEFNSFIVGAIADADVAFTASGHTGIDTKFVSTNPSVAKDIFSPEVLTLLPVLATDNYPEGTGGNSYASCNTSMNNELNQWMLSGKPYHITLGANVYTQLNEKKQKNCEQGDIDAVKAHNFTGITAWQSSFGKSRLFDFLNGVWVPRSVVSVINNAFIQ